MSKTFEQMDPAELRKLPWEQLCAILGDQVLWLDDGPDGTRVGVRVGPRDEPVILFAHLTDDGGYEPVVADKRDYLDAYRRFFKIE